MSTTTDFATCDLCDAHKAGYAEGDAAFRVLPPVFASYGGRARFCGPVLTVKCFEDNSPVKAALESAGEGRVLVVDGGGSLRRALIGVFGNDDCVIATQFKQTSSQALANGRTNGLSHAGAACGGYQGYACIVAHPFTHISASADDRGNAFGHLILFKNRIDDVLAGNGAKRHFLTRFPHAYIAAYPGKGRIPAPYGHREIECGYNAYDPQWMVLFVHPVPRSLAVHG